MRACTNKRRNHKISINDEDNMKGHTDRVDNDRRFCLKAVLTQNHKKYCIAIRYFGMNEGRGHGHHHHRHSSTNHMIICSSPIFTNTLYSSLT